MQPLQSGQTPDWGQPTEPMQPLEPKRRRRSLEPASIRLLDRLVQIIYILTFMVDVLLVIRFVLKLLAANPQAAFTAFIYGVSDPLVQPFTGVFPNATQRGNVLEPASLLAIVIYSLVAFLLVRIIEMVVDRDARLE